MRFDLNDVKVEVLKIMKADPRRVSGIELTFHIPDQLKDIDEKTKAILRQAGETCPVFKSIHPQIEVKVDWGRWT
jgi:putative redox protein